MTRTSTHKPNIHMNSTMGFKARSLLISICCFLSCSAYSADQILVLMSSNAPAYQEVFTTFNSQLSDSVTADKPQITGFTLKDLRGHPQANSILKSAALIIAIGSKASAYINKTEISAPALSVFLTQDSWHKIRMGSMFQKNKTAIYLDQPYQRFTQLCSLLPINVRSLGAVFGPSSLDKFKILEHFSDANGLLLNARLLNKDDNPITVIEPLFKQSDLFLALPDTTVFNQTTAKWILILAMKYKKPVIGFSQAYTKAGALAALHSTPKDTGKDTAHWVRQWLNSQGTAMLSPRFNRIFTLSINPQVARLLGVSGLNAESLKQSLIELEQGNSLLNEHSIQSAHD